MQFTTLLVATIMAFASSTATAIPTHPILPRQVVAPRVIPDGIFPRQFVPTGTVGVFPTGTAGVLATGTATGVFPTST
jgi:hypothetical protein